MLCFAVVLALQSCSKDDVTVQSDGPIITYKLDKIPLTELSQAGARSYSQDDVFKLIENSEDRDDEKISSYLYYLGEAMFDLIKDPIFNRLIIRLARESETGTANLLLLEEQGRVYYDVINEKLKPYNLDLKLIAENMTHKPVAPNPDYPETAIQEKYVPSIFIPNLDKVDESLQPIMSANVEINSVDNDVIQDHVISWYFFDENAATPRYFLLGEETSINSANPIFLVDNAVTTLRTDVNLNAVSMDVEQESASSMMMGGQLSFDSYEHSIESSAYRYEPWTSGRSEFAVTAYRIDPSGAVHWLYNQNDNSSKVISEITTNQVGSIRYVWSYHAANWTPWSNPWTHNVIQNGVNMVFWNTFERDWNRSPKELGTCSANGSTINLSGRRRYSSEWYAWIPSTAQIHYTKFEWVHSNWAHWCNSWKSKFRIWRVGA